MVLKRRPCTRRVSNKHSYKQKKINPEVVFKWICFKLPLEMSGQPSNYTKMWVIMYSIHLNSI